MEAQQFIRTPKHRRSVKRRQLQAIADQLEHALSSLECACVAVVQFEQELEVFLREYYDHVGPYCEELESLRQQRALLTRTEQATKPSSAQFYFQQSVTQVMQETQRHTHRREAKSMCQKLYHSMAKAYHPDSQTKHNDVVTTLKESIIKQLNHAYDQGNLAALWRMKYRMEDRELLKSEPLYETTQRYEERLEEVTEALHRMEVKRAKMENSPSAALMTKALQSRLSGKSFYDPIIDQLQLDIEKERRELITSQIHQLSEWREQLSK